jgi:uncharacterized coiled-coil protein SlyX
MSAAQRGVLDFLFTAEFRTNAMEKELHDRLTKLESHLMHLEHLCDQLNQVALEQGRQIAKMAAQQQRISETVDNIELDRIKSTNTKPPHYQ